MKSPRLKSIILEDGTIIHDVIGADSGQEDDDTNDDDEEEDDLDDDNGEDEDEDDEDGDTVDSLRVRIEELEAANRKATRRMKAADRAKINAEKKLAAAGAKPASKAKNEEDEDTRDATIADLQAKLAAASGSDKANAVRDEFRDLEGYAWHDSKLVFSLLDLDEIDVEDGDVDVDSLKDAVKALVKTKPFLLKQNSNEDDEEEDDEAERKRSRSGSHTRRRKSKTTDRTALARKYPALASRG